MPLSTRWEPGHNSIGHQSLMFSRGSIPGCSSSELGRSARFTSFLNRGGESSSRNLRMNEMNEMSVPACSGRPVTALFYVSLLDCLKSGMIRPLPHSIPMTRLLGLSHMRTALLIGSTFCAMQDWATEVAQSCIAFTARSNST